MSGRCQPKSGRAQVGNKIALRRPGGRPTRAPLAPPTLPSPPPLRASSRDMQTVLGSTYTSDAHRQPVPVSPICTHGMAGCGVVATVEYRATLVNKCLSLDPMLPTYACLPFPFPTEASPATDLARYGSARSQGALRFLEYGAFRQYDRCDLVMQLLAFSSSNMTTRDHSSFSIRGHTMLAELNKPLTPFLDIAWLLYPSSISNLRTFSFPFQEHRPAPVSRPRTPPV